MMIIKINKKIMLMSIGALFIGGITIFALINTTHPKSIIAGGNMHSSIHNTQDALTVSKQQDIIISERFQRPSKALPLSNPYSFKDFVKDDDTPPLINKKFEASDDLILAYFAIIKEASNMVGYSGGCGSIGQSGLPYPYAYELLTEKKQKQLSLNSFTDSFKGIGYTTLLQMAPAYSPPDKPNIKNYMVEIEVITGKEMKNNESGSQFAYYYGLISTEKTKNSGWRIKDINYIPQDFLCAPAHNWFYLSDAVVQIVHGDNLKIIEKIDKMEHKDNMTYIYASGNGKQYRFDFVRLTNGYDILLHENVFENNTWKETNLLTGDWKNYKLTVDNYQIAD